MKIFGDIKCIKTFLRYPGNKSRLLKQIIPYVPKEFNTYYEPFLGSGAMFLCLQPTKAILNDINKDVINTWKHVKENHELLLKGIQNYTKKLQKLNDKTKQLSWARKLTDKLNIMDYDLKRAILYIFLKQIVYKGYLNKKSGKYYFDAMNNNSIYSFLTIKNKLNYFKTSELFKKNIKIYCKDYKNIINKAKSNDFIYLDPPYIHDNNNPIIYNYKSNDIINDIKRIMDQLSKRNIKIMLSMSDFPEIRNLFKNYNIIELSVYRGYGNNYKIELLILNY